LCRRADNGTSHQAEQLCFEFAKELERIEQLLAA
jgi:hypothetical protein